MRLITLLIVLFPLLAYADNDPGFARAIKKGKLHRIDRCMKRFIQREGRDVRPASYLQPLGGAEARIGELYASLRTQIGVIDLDWDRCVIKPAIWPGTWTLGVIYSTPDGLQERCYTIRGGRMGTINLFGWRPHIRPARDDLHVIKVKACEGFVEEQRRICEERSR